MEKNKTIDIDIYLKNNQYRMGKKRKKL